MYENKKIKASIYKFFGHKHLLLCIPPRFGGCLIFAPAACFSLRSRYFSNQRFHISSSFSRISNGNDVRYSCITIVLPLSNSKIDIYNFMLIKYSAIGIDSSDSVSAANNIQRIACFLVFCYKFFQNLH